VTRLDPERWRALRPLLDEALELPAGERAAFLDRACAGDPTLRAELEALLAADAAAEHSPAGGALDAPAGAVARALLAEGGAPGPGGPGEAPAERWVGRTLGPYRILRLLGEGGMGIVFEAEQENPRRLVALKVVRGGAFLDDARLRLFRREIEALARLRHPSIAPIYDAGRTDDGQHYFAMELVRGAPLDEHLRERPREGGEAADLRARLALFLEICDAIAYAHQRGVVHRDLKPSNVVVEDEAREGDSGSRRPRVKVLDFGLARITEGDVALSTRRTEPRAIEGTLPYMSPEQARGEPVSIDLRSDVYSLGVLLFEMLTGELPYEVPRGPLHESLRAICEAPPRRPSLIVPALRGDLEVIVLKALEKVPSARYATVPALADDVRRALDDQPITARPPGAAEQLRRFARRHRTAAAFSAVAAGLLVLGAAGTTIGMLRARAAEQEAKRLAAEAREEARTAESVSRFLVGLFEAADPESSKADAITARQLLDKGTHQLENSLQDEPIVRARLYQTLGTVHRNLGLYRQAREQLTRALALRRETLGPDHLDVATSEYVLAGLLRRLGEYDEAERRYRAALEIRLKALGPDHRDVAGSYGGLANVFIERGEYARARPLCEQALATIERAVGPEDAAVTLYLYNLALLLKSMDDLAAARPLVERAIRIEERSLGPEHPSIGGDHVMLGEIMARLGDVPGGLAEMRRGIAIEEKGFGAGHAYVGESRTGLSAVLHQAGDFESARAEAERAVRILERALGPEHATTAMARDQQSVALRSLGRVDEAIAMSGRALRTLERGLGPGHQAVGTALANLAGHHAARGDRVRARELYRRALDVLGRALGPAHRQVEQTAQALDALD